MNCSTSAISCGRKWLLPGLIEVESGRILDVIVIAIREDEYIKGQNLRAETLKTPDLRLEAKKKKLSDCVNVR